MDRKNVPESEKAASTQDIVAGSERERSARIGLFGGTFDPVHFGHLRPALELAEAYQLDTLYLLPNHRPVHRAPTRASTETRIEMLELATCSAPRLSIDTREALRDEPSYTFDTLTAISEENPQATLIFFMGLDAFALYDTWHEQEGILDLANLVIIKRPDAQHSDFSAALLARQKVRSGNSICHGVNGVIEEIEVTQLAISSTDIRRRIARGLNVRFLVPESVLSFIETKNLYKTEKHR